MKISMAPVQEWHIRDDEKSSGERIVANDCKTMQMHLLLLNYTLNNS